MKYLRKQMIQGLIPGSLWHKYVLARYLHAFSVSPISSLQTENDRYMIMRADQIKELMQIPGVGKSIATDLVRIGINSVQDLKGKDPEVLYKRSNAMAGKTQDRCLLYVLRCAVYFADTKPEKHNPEKLKWWNWKDRKNK